MKTIVRSALFLWAAAAIASAGGSSAEEQPKSKRMRPALLVIDIQNEYLKWTSAEDREMAMAMINYAIGLFRENGFPVIRVYNTDPQYGPKPGTDAFEFPSTVSVKPDDPMAVKNFANGFKKTDLEKILRAKGCNTVFLCGLSAVGCVLATYQGASDLDFNAFLIKDALMSHNADYTNAVEDMFDAVGYNAMKVMLENAEK